jgi:hypothetical protein
MAVPVHGYEADHHGWHSGELRTVIALDGVRSIAGRWRAKGVRKRRPRANVNPGRQKRWMGHS